MNPFTSEHQQFDCTWDYENLTVEQRLISLLQMLLQSQQIEIFLSLSNNLKTLLLEDPLLYVKSKDHTKFRVC